MKSILEVVSQNHITVVAVLGILICLAGLLLLLVPNSKTHAVVLVVVGAVFVALPFIASFKLTKDGFEILTKTQQLNAELAKTVDDHRQAIEEIRTGLAAVQAFSQNAERLARLEGSSSDIPTVDFETLDRSLGQSIEKTDGLLNSTQDRQQGVEQLLRENNRLIERISPMF